MCDNFEEELLSFLADDTDIDCQETSENNSQFKKLSLSNCLFSVGNEPKDNNFDEVFTEDEHELIDPDKMDVLSNYGQNINNILQKRSLSIDSSEEFSNVGVKDKLPDNQSSVVEKLKIKREKAKVALSSALSANFNSKFSDGDRIPGTALTYISPQISSLDLKEKIGDKNIIPPSSLYKKVGSNELDLDWIMFAVIVAKLPVQKSAKGNSYCIMKLSDLDDCDKVICLFLFGKVFEAHWKLSQGSVIGLLNAEIMPNAEKFKQSNSISMKVNHPKKLLFIGYSNQLGQCKGKTRAGEICRNFVNKLKSPYCNFHIQNEYRKMGNKRTELQCGFRAPEPKKFKREFYNASNSTPSAVIHDGNFLQARKSGGSKRSKINMSSVIQHQEQLCFPSTLKLQGKIPEEDKQRILTLKQETRERAEDKKKFLEMLSNPTAGSMNFVKHLKDTEIVPKKSDESVVLKLAKVKNIVSITANDFLKSFAIPKKPMMQNNASISSKNKFTSIPPLKRSQSLSNATVHSSAKPQIGRGLNKTDYVNLSDNFADSLTRSSNLANISASMLARKKAASIIKFRKEHEPASTHSNRPALSPRSKKALRKRVLAGIANSTPDIIKNLTTKSRLDNDDDKKNLLSDCDHNSFNNNGDDGLDKENIEQNVEYTIGKKKKKFSSNDVTDIIKSNDSALGSALTKEQIEKLLSSENGSGKGSSTGIIGSQMESKRLDQYFDSVEKKEQTEIRMTQLTSIKCKIVSCKQCGYSALSAAPKCIENQHKLKVTNGKKRFFECSSCHKRTISIDKYPKRACAKCGEKVFRKAGMWRERKGPEDPTHNLELRGEELKFLNC